MTITWETEELAEAQRQEVRIFISNLNKSEFDDSQLPTDIHLVEYTVGETLYVDAVRSYKMVKIFDVYYDKLRPLGGEVKSITSGYGRIKPKLFKEDKKTKE